AEALDPRAVPPAAADRDLPDLRGVAVLVPEVRAGRRRLLRGRGRAVLPLRRLAGRAARPRPPLGRALDGVPRRGPGDRVRAVPVLPVPEEAGAVGGAGDAGVGAGGAGRVGAGGPVGEGPGGRLPRHAGGEDGAGGVRRLPRGVPLSRGATGG